MNKILKNSILLLLSILTIIGCGDETATRSRYDIERKFHKAEKEFEDAKLKKQFENSETIASLLSQYREITDDCYELLKTLDPEKKETSEVQYLTFQAVSRLSQFYYAKRNYDSSATVIKELLDKVPMKGIPLIESYINYGQSLHSAGKWDSTQIIYRYAIEKFYPPQAPTGDIVFKLFNLPYHIFRVVNTAGEESQSQYDYALSYYSQLIADYPNSKLEASAHANLALLYHDKELWTKEIEELTLINDTTKRTRINLNIKIADLYADKLNDYKKALETYNTVRAQLTPDDTLIMALTTFRIANVHMEQKKFTEARELLNDIKKDYRYFYDQTPSVQLLIGRTFEKENNWQRAEIEFNLLIEKYRVSDEALATYLHMVNHYSETGLKSEKERWINEAVRNYDDIIERYSGSLLEAKAMIFKADLFRQLKQWQRSVDMMLIIFEKYPASEYGKRAILSAADIYQVELSDKAKADELRLKLKNAMAVTGN